MQTYLFIAISIYLVVMFAISYWSKSKITNETDYIVAGRRLPFVFATSTLLATWFGAGTLLTATDEIRVSGLSASFLEPYGSGLCLILAGLFFAKPLWEMKILTLSDFYRKRFGKKAEFASVFLTVPGYIGWIAVQLIGAAGILSVFFDLSLEMGMVTVCVVAMIYTFFGGMWSVTVTDTVQMGLILVGVLALGYSVFSQMGGGDWILGFEQIMERTPDQDLVLVPTERMGEFFGWLGLFATAALGNLPGQDLAQRIFSSRSSKVAQGACLVSGILYIALGTVPVLLAVAAKHILPPDVVQGVLPALAKQFFNPVVTTVFVLTILSVVLSTIDSAILAAASTLSHNFLRQRFPEVSPVLLCKYCVIGISLAGLGVAFSGENAASILEASYASTFAGLFVPLVAGIFIKKPTERAVLWSMGVGISIWLLEFIVTDEIPFALIAVAAAFATYLWVNRDENRALQKKKAQEETHSISPRSSSVSSRSPLEVPFRGI